MSTLGFIRASTGIMMTLADMIVFSGTIRFLVKMEKKQGQVHGVVAKAVYEQCDDGHRTVTVPDMDVVFSTLLT